LGHTPDLPNLTRKSWRRYVDIITDPMKEGLKSVEINSSNISSG
jgi:hypothetical protein